ncbi:MAG: AzlD domain-containing protein [Bacillota bacterium]|nr:AzlD domain-containing protein [Bacillota bacterium]
MKETALLIFLMTAVTYLPRVIPALILSRSRLPRWITLWLSYVPVAVLAALLAPALFAPAGKLDLSLQTNPAFWVSIPVFALALYTRNLFITVIVGMVLIALLRMAI